LTIDQLAAEIERAYYSDAAVRCASGEPVGEAEQVAANTHLPTLSQYTARAAVRWARRAKRPARYGPDFVATQVSREAEGLLKTDPPVGIALSTIGALLLRSLLENLAWRFALWLFSDATHEDRPDLICRMEGE
jgi:hypothetical protein